MKKIQGKNSSELKEYIEFAEIVSELGDAIVRYYPQDVLERFKTGITPNCFETIEEYEEFIHLLSEFTINYEIMLNDNKFGSKKGINSQQKTMELMKQIREKYPKQFEQLLLLQVLIESNSPYIIEASLKYLKGKNVYVERYLQDSNGYKYIDIASTTELDYGFLQKEPKQRGEYEIRLRKYSKEEADFLKSVKAVSSIEYLTPADFVYCAKKPEFADALFFNMFSYLQFAREKSSEETFNSLVGLVYRNIQFLNMSKFKTLLLHRAMQYNEIATSEHEMEYQESVIRDLLEKMKATKNVNIVLDDFSVNVPDPLEYSFEPHEKRENVVNNFPPIQVLTSDSNLEKTPIDIKGGFEVSTREVIAKAEEFLLKRRISKFLEQYKRNELTDTGINLKNHTNLVALKEGLKQRLRDANLDLSDAELEDMYFMECQKLVTFLCNKNLIDIQLAKRFDEIVTAQLICDGVFNVQDRDLPRFGFSKNAIIYICKHSPERISSLMKLGLIKKEELLGEEQLSVDIIQILFSNSDITVRDLMELLEKNKIDLTSLKKIEIEDKKSLEEQLDPLALSKLYVDINKKRNEYENESRTSYDKALDQGVSEDEIEPSQRELELQEELQNLINQKNMYIFLLDSLGLKDKDRKSFCEKVFLGPVDNVEERDFIHIIEDMYKDGMVSIDQINDLDSNIFIELLKTGVILEEDIKEFKKSAVLEEELEELRNRCATEEEYLKEVDLLRYTRLDDIVAPIIKDSQLSDEEKIGIIYSIYTLNTPVEQALRDAYAKDIFAGKIDSKYDFLKEMYTTNHSRKKINRNKRPDNDTANNKKYDSYLYPEYTIWEFMRLLDPKVAIRVYKDGYATFSSKKLDKVMIEKVWKGNGKALDREYGVATISMDLETFENNISRIVQYRRNGYRINAVNAKELLPVVKHKDKEKRVGLIRHNKDLNHSGRKNWFELLLDNFGIDLGEIRQGKDTKYTPEDADRIEAALEAVRNSYERI